MNECEDFLLRQDYALLKQAEKIPRPNYTLIYIRASMGEQNKEYLMLVRPKPECNEGEGGRYHGH